MIFFFLMRRRPPRSTRTDTLFPYTTLFRSWRAVIAGIALSLIATRGGSRQTRLSSRSPADIGAREDAPGIGVIGKALQTAAPKGKLPVARIGRSEEHTSELQSLMRISYAVFCLKKKKKHH